MKNNITELVFILDRSGSMSGLEQDTIGGFNSLIEKQRRQNGKCYVSTVLFDHETEVLHDRVELSEISKMTENDYTVRGSTALIDAIGGAIHHIGNIHKYAREEDVPEHTLFVIMTDGMENASRIYSSSKVKKMIERQKNRYGWEFLLSELTLIPFKPLSISESIPTAPLIITLTVRVRLLFLTQYRKPCAISEKADRFHRLGAMR